MNILLGGTHGLGWDLALKLQQAEESTFIIGRSYNESLHGDGMAADLSNDHDVEKVLHELKSFGETSIKSFYWVAGYGYSGDFADQPEAGKMSKVNFANAVPIVQAVWRQMLAQTVPTHFVVVSSTTGIKARNNEAVYAATKHAQVGFARSLGLESERLKAMVRVVLFMPGGMQTPFWEGNEPANISEYLDPVKVAQKIHDSVAAQRTNFYEEIIERGSL